MSYVAVSSTEAEYMALSDTSRDAIAKSQPFNELRLSLPTPIVHCDNQGALTISEDPMNYQRAKHIDIRYHFVHHALLDSKISLLEYIFGTENPADIMTKSLPSFQNRLCIENLNLVDLN
jgi:hypothetical protein